MKYRKHPAVQFGVLVLAIASGLSLGGCPLSASETKAAKEEIAIASSGRDAAPSRIAEDRGTAPAKLQEVQGVTLSLKPEQQVQTTQDQFTPNEPIVVKFENLPGNAQDWITVVEATAPDDTYGEWIYTEGKVSGTHQFNALGVGNYEVRVYHNWPDGDYVVQDRYPFKVVAGTTTLPPTGSTYLSLAQSSYSPQTPVVVNYNNLPGNTQDWITVVKQSDPDDTYGDWFYTEGKKTGSHQFTGLESGDYEVRVYFNWPDGGYTVQQRLPFKVQ